MVTSFNGEYDNTMADLLARRETAFVLWHFTNSQAAPRLVIGWAQPGTPLTLAGEQSLALRPVPGVPDLWELPAVECGLIDGWIYYYWFEVTRTDPAAGDSAAGDPAAGEPEGMPARVRITDPLASAVDWRLLSDGRYPAASVKFLGGRLVRADVGGEQPSFVASAPRDRLPPNHRLVIYDLPTAWASPGNGSRAAGVGSFRDIRSLVDVTASGATFGQLAVTRPGRAYLSAELGVNALEIRPADESNVSAPEFALGFPSTYSWPAPNRDLAELAATCRNLGVRLIAGLPVRLAKDNPWLAATGETGYDDFAATYDPVSGATGTFSPARQFMKTALDRWIQDFQLDGIRFDDAGDSASTDFARELKEHARQRYRERCAIAGSEPDADERFIVMGDAAGDAEKWPHARPFDGQWHEPFKHYIRMALVGHSHEHEPGFEATVRRAIDCRAFGYEDLSQAVIYLTSPRVDGFRNERLFNFFRHTGVADAEKRTKLAFACLLTAVGIPMILAGEEFANLADHRVDFSHLGDDWRERIKTYVSRLIRLRTTYDALAVNDVDFIHADFTEGKRVMVWRRGVPGSDAQVIVVANFSDFTTADAGEPHAEYVVPNWPQVPAHKRWREVPQDRWVDEARAGREPLFAWEAKVYALM